MNDIREVALELIDDNPFQDRELYEDIDGLGRIIAVHGLEENPKARACDGGRYQLKYGHRRKRAFAWLKDHWKAEKLPDRYNGYTVIPLEVEELTDREMFDGVVIENVHRKDLKVTERARLLKRYREQFPDATSDEIGLVFGMAGATVRGMDIFLDLPKPVQQKLDAGEISQGVARTFHSLQRIAPEDVVVEALDAIEKGVDRFGDRCTPDEILEEILEENDDILEMWSGDGKPHAGGRDGWALDMKKFPNLYLPQLTPVDAAMALGIQDDVKVMKLVEEYLVNDNYEFNECEPVLGCKEEAEELLGQLAKVDQQHADRLLHLKSPPACTACPFHTVINGTHYCGLRTCYERKEQAWRREQLHRTSKDLNIPIYDPKMDGSEFRVLEDHYYVTSEHWELWQKKSKDLRLAMMVDIDRQKGQDGYGLPRRTCALLVGKTLKDLLEKKHDERVDKRQKENAAQARAAYRAEKGKALAWEASQHIKAIFDGINADALETLWSSSRGWDYYGNRKQRGDKDHADVQRCVLAMNMICEEANWMHSGSQTLEVYATRLTEHAKSWGVKLPKSIMKMAQEFDAGMPGSVAAETPKKKGKK